MHLTVLEQARLAQSAVPQLQQTTAQLRTQVLQDLGRCLSEKQDEIMQVNAQEVAEQVQRGISQALQDRLRLTKTRIQSMIDGVLQIAAAPDILGQEINSWQRPNGLRVSQVRVPLGVIGIIYEARPNVTIDAAALCLKSGNGVLLRGSRLAAQTNALLIQLMGQVLRQHGLPTALVQGVQDTSRDAVTEMVQARGLLDLIVPRGGAELISHVVKTATVPVLETGVGNCHLFIDASAPVDMAISIAINGKCSRPAVCNAIETILVHKQWAQRHLYELIDQLQLAGVQVRFCSQLQPLVPNGIRATEDDWATEYLDLVVSIKQVASVEEAIAHIRQYGSKHSEAIVSLELASVQQFFSSVDAACLYHNACTRFSDGYALGLGAEIGISTQKLHARGPVGINGLTTYKYLISGTGQVR